MSATSPLTFVTGNANKLREVVEILTNGDPSTPLGPYHLTNQPLDLDELQGTVESVTQHKTAQAAELVKGPVIVEDTCLCFTALGDLPGPYIKWFAKQAGLEGLVKMLAAFDDKSAKAITTFGYCEGPGKEVLLFQGITEGTIVDLRGSREFGWDSIFMPNGWEETYSELKGERKNSISQRGKALAKLREFLTAL
ncbi:nucleoside triphosphate pyrophosphohydrolase [Martiniozyma asiatica (nom. inval.)]|nr:nucleoside triphosphate pyrophosphohydrolase [Martiniozyma asiatica]